MPRVVFRIVLSRPVLDSNLLLHKPVPVLFGDTKQTLMSARSARVKGNGSRQIFYVVASQVLEDALCPMAIKIERKDAARSFPKLQSNSLYYTIHPIQIRWGVVMLWFVPVGEIPAGMRVNGYLFPIERNKAKGRRATFQLLTPRQTLRGLASRHGKIKREEFKKRVTVVSGGLLL